MENFEKVEKLTERANVSYAEAKAALEATNWDLLDAMIYLERQGKTAGPAKAAFTTSVEAEEVNKSTESGSRFKERAATLGEKLKELAKKSDENHFIVERKGKEIINVPVWALILVLFFFWELALVLFIIGLFIGCRYSFRGPGELEAVNKVMESVEDTADSIKDSINNL